MLHSKRPLSEKRALSRFVVFRLMEDWQVFYDKLKTHKRVKINSEVPSIVRMYKASDTLYKAFQEEINQTVRKHFKEEDEFQDHKISLSALKEVLGKNKNRSKKYKQKRQEVYESLAIYCGFEGYQDFQKLYQLYHRSIDIFQAFDILTSNHSNYLEQITKLLQEYEQQIQHFLPKGQEYDIQKLATVKVQSDKSIQEMKVYELLALASQHQDPLQRMHQIIYVQHEHFEKAETALVLYHKNKKRRKILIPSFLMGILLFTLVSWYSLQANSEENQARQLTQADFDKVKIEILHISKDSKGTATVEVAYDASHLGNDLEQYDLSFGTSMHTGAKPIKISKPIDTLMLTYEVAGRHFIALGK